MRDNSQSVIDKLRSYDLFRDVDFSALLRKHDGRAALGSTSPALPDPPGATVQLSSAVTAIPPAGIIIDQPGTYVFTDDLNWAPVSGSAAIAITIKCSGVILDLGGHCLSAEIGDSSQRIIGIHVKEASNVTIRNGTLANMGLYGIYACLVAELTIDTVTVTGLEYRNLNIRNATPCGIQVSLATGVTISHCTSQYFYALSDSSAAFQLLGVIGATISACKALHLVNYDGAVQGFNYLLCLNVVTSKCEARDFRSYFNGNIRTHGHTVLGFIPIACFDLRYTDCRSVDMIGSCDDAHGMSVFLNALVEVDGFTARGVVDGPPPYNTGAKATGLEVYGVDIGIRNCNVEQITAINPQDRQAAGFSAWGRGITFETCNATGVRACDSDGNEGPEIGFGTGFGWAPDPRREFRAVTAKDIKYAACTAVNCQVGFDTWNHVDSIWINYATQNCGVPVLIEGPGATRTLVGNPGSECNPPINVTLENQAHGNRFIEFDPVG